MCDNLGDHLVGNVYIKVSKMRISYAIVGVFCFSFQMKRQQRRLFRISTIAGFNGQPIHAELSPVTDFREACCRQYDNGLVVLLHCLVWLMYVCVCVYIRECTRGGFCNFMHRKKISKELE